MNEGDRNDTNSLKEELQTLANKVQALAEKFRGDSLELLALLRMLESLHQEIRDNLFQQSLPSNRQALYNLLRDIEMTGGWPYVPRMKLQTLLANLPILPELDGASTSSEALRNQAATGPSTE